MAFFKKFNCQFQNLRLRVCLAMCLKFPEFEAGCAYKLVAYKKKTCTSRTMPTRAILGFISSTYTIPPHPNDLNIHTDLERKPEGLCLLSTEGLLL